MKKKQRRTVMNRLIMGLGNRLSRHLAGSDHHLRYAHLDCRGFLSLALERAKTFRVLMNEKE